MLSLVRGSFRTRVARRTFGLFVISALLPLLFTGWIVERGITEKLTGEAEQRLKDAAKSYGLGVFERLDAASSQLRWQAAIVATPGQADTGPMFTAASLVADDGKVRRLFGGAIPPADSLAAGRALDAAGRDVILFEPAAFPLGSLLLAVRTGAGVVTGLLRPEYVWSRVDNNPTATDFCVKMSSRGLYCPAGEVAPTEQLLVGHWNLFMRASFAAADWEVMARQPADLALASLHALHRSWPLVFTGAFLLSVLLSLVQIRRRHAPLEQLLAATRRIEQGQLGEPVVVDSDDEYELIGRALEGASSALRDQLELHDVVSQIDRSIIESRALGAAVQQLLPAIARLLGSEAVVAILKQADDPGLRVLSWTGNLQDRVVPDATDWFHAAAEAGKMGRGTPGAEAILPAGWIKEDGFVRLWPFRDGDKVLGAIGCLQGGGSVGEFVRGAGEQIASRLSVALADRGHRQQLLKQAFYDRLTGLPNRSALIERLQVECQRAARDQLLLAVMFLDLDKFKLVNDTLGHSAGDELLQVLAGRLRDSVPHGAALARLGGDEFAIVLTDIARPGDASATAVRVQQEMSRPVSIGGQTQHCSVSVGIAMFPDSGSGPEELLRNADTAVYRAKARALGSVMFHEEDMNRQLQRRAYLEHELRLAIESGGIELVCQPKLDLAIGRPAGAEVLARWTHPADGPVSPAEFVPIAEEFGLMPDLGWLVMTKACASLAAWRDRGLDPGHLAVNVSVKQFANSCFAEEVIGLLASHELPAAWLEIEVTESVLEDRFGDVLAQLSCFRQAGIRISIDDFGTGYSSLAALQKLPFDTLKIDRAFVNAMSGSADGQAIVQAVIVMGRALSKTIVAEGIETPDELQLLEQFGCHQGQGYLFSRPVDLQTYETEWLGVGPGAALAASRRSA